MQEARAVAEARRDLLRIADRLSHSLQEHVVRGIHLDVGQDTEIVPRLQAVQVRLEIP